MCLLSARFVVAWARQLERSVLSFNVCGVFCRSPERRNPQPGKGHRTSGLVLQRILHPLWTGYVRLLAFSSGVSVARPVPRVSLSYRLLGRRGSLPWVRNAGVWPVDSDVLVFTASKISGHFSSNFLWSCPANCAIMVLTVLFARSVGLSCGVYGAVNCCLIPISARKLFNIRLANCTPLWPPSRPRTLRLCAP